MSTTVTGTRANNACWLQIIIEIEHTDPAANYLLMVTNSLPDPSAGGVYDNYGELGTLAQMWATRTRNFASSIGVAGSYASAYSSVNSKWNIFDNFTIPYVPDVVLYFASASSDVADSTSDTTTNDIKTNVINMIKAGRTKYPTARQWLTDIPRGSRSRVRRHLPPPTRGTTQAQPVAAHAAGPDRTVPQHRRAGHRLGHGRGQSGGPPAAGADDR